MNPSHPYFNQRFESLSPSVRMQIIRQAIPTAMLWIAEALKAAHYMEDKVSLLRLQARFSAIQLELAALRLPTAQEAFSGRNRNVQVRNGLSEGFRENEGDVNVIRTLNTFEIAFCEAWDDFCIEISPFS